MGQVQFFDFQVATRDIEGLTDARGDSIKSMLESDYSISVDSVKVILGYQVKSDISESDAQSAIYDLFADPIIEVGVVNKSIINNHEFGNGTSIYTSNGTFARNFMKDVQIGMVGINIPIPVPMSFYSFGGWKGSIFGGHGMHGEEGINFYTKRKTITSRWPEDVAGASLNMPTMK